MQIEQYQQWVRQFYQQQGWYERSPFMRVTYLAEEIGEVACAVERLKSGVNDRTKPKLHNSKNEIT